MKDYIAPSRVVPLEQLPVAAAPSYTCLDGEHTICGGVVAGTHRCACPCHVLDVQLERLREATDL